MPSRKAVVSEMDVAFLAIIRRNVTEFTHRCAEQFDGEGLVLLDVAPQDHEGARASFQRCRIVTMDIDPSAKADVTADLTKNNSASIAADFFDMVLCTEVLEHTLQPFDAVKEILRILKPGGRAFVTTPFNFRIHGPLPDCWRFTEHGLRALFSEFEIESLEEIATEGRDLMPIHYSLVARKKS